MDGVDLLLTGMATIGTGVCAYQLGKLQGERAVTEEAGRRAGETAMVRALDALTESLRGRRERA